MQRRQLWFFAFLAVAACQTERVNAPTDTVPGSGVSLAISDALHGNTSSPDFFWLPPMVPQPPTGLTTFNPNLSPTVEICEWDGADCVGGGYQQTFMNVMVADDHYHQNWKIPRAANGTVFRVRVLVDDVELGFADVKLSKNPGDGFVGAQANQTIPIRFWINTTCATETCTQGFVDPEEGGTVLFGETQDEPPTGGVTVPPQEEEGPPITLTIKPCPSGDLGQAGLTVFGTCITIESSLEELSEEALVFICDVLDATDELPADRRDRIHLHKRSNGVITALQNSFAPLCVEEEASVGGAIRALVQGDWKRAGRQIAGLVTPRPAYALHLGAGGSTGTFSDFQFAEEYGEGFEGGIPAGWTTDGTSGTSTALTNLGPTEGNNFGFITTPGNVNTSLGGTGGTTLTSSTFSAVGGQQLSLDFNFLTTDGTTSFQDFMFIQLLDASNAVVATLANGNTTGATSQAVPALGGPAPGITAGVALSGTIPRFFDGIATGPLGGVTFGPSKFGGGNGGSTGWITSTFTIPTTGTYKLLFVVMDFGNRNFPSALAIDNIAVTSP